MLVLLSRIQFAFTIIFHFLFVPLTIGLILLTAIFETIHLKTKNPLYRRMADFWGDLFVINFAVGIVTGVVMSVQFGTNWAGYSVFMGDVFGAPLALEALLAFFLESTFAGIWIFKRKVLSAGMRSLVVWMVVLGTTISAVWIITANGFMQHPVGYQLSADGSKVLLTDIFALVTNPYAIYMLVHTLVAAFVLGAFFVIGVSAYHLKRKKCGLLQEIYRDRCCDRIGCNHRIAHRRQELRQISRPGRRAASKGRHFAGQGGRGRKYGRCCACSN